MVSVMVLLLLLEAKAGESWVLWVVGVSHHGLTIMVRKIIAIITIIINTTIIREFNRPKVRRRMFCVCQKRILSKFASVLWFLLAG